MDPQDRLILVTGGARSGKSTFAERLAAELAEQRAAREATEPGGARASAGTAAQRSPVVYLATSETNDPEMAARVAAHRAARPAAWTTVECPLYVPAAVRAHVGARRADRAPGDVGLSGAPDPASPIFLLDCVTFWVSNLLLAGGDLGGTHPGDEFNYDKSLIGAEQERSAAERVAGAVDGLFSALHETGATLIAVTNEVGLGVVPEYPLARLYRDQLGWANQRLAAAAGRVFFLVAGFALDVRELSMPWPGSGAQAADAPAALAGAEPSPEEPNPAKEPDQ